MIWRLVHNVDRSLCYITVEELDHNVTVIYCVADPQRVIFNNDETDWTAKRQIGPRCDRALISLHNLCITTTMKQMIVFMLIILKL